MSEPDRTIPYVSRKSLFQRWTSIGIAAITLSGVGFVTTLAFVFFRLAFSDFEIPDWAAVLLVLTIIGTCGLGCMAGMIAILSGTADPFSRRDAHMGLIAMLMTFTLIALFFVLFLFG